MTHRSHSATHNERLEFLGDSVLNCVVAALLYQRYSKLDEGDLSRVRANLVKQQSLYEIAGALNIAEFLRLGEGELRSGGFRRPSILADTLEAIFGAVYVDAGFEAAQGVISRLYIPILDHIDPSTLGKDAKTLLQEYLQGHKIALPLYTVVATHGAAHNQQFEVECTVPKLEIKVFGSGASRRAAEQAAAKKALEEVQTVAPALLGKPKRSKSSRAAKLRGENETVQGALDLRTPSERKGRNAQTTAKTAEHGDERAAGVPGDAAALVPRPVPTAVPMIRAAHVESGEIRAEVEKADKASDKAPEKLVERMTERGADKPPEKSSAKVADKAVDKPADKTADKPADKSTDKPADKSAKPANAAPDSAAQDAEARAGAPGKVRSADADA